MFRECLLVVDTTIERMSRASMNAVVSVVFGLILVSTYLNTPDSLFRATAVVIISELHLKFNLGAF